MKKLLCLLFAALLLCVSASALELPSELDGTVPRELIDNAETGDDLLLRGGQYLFSHFRAALQDAVANSLRGAMALMLLSLLCGLVESTAESAGETPARYAGYLGVLGAAALSAGDLSALIGLGVETILVRKNICSFSSLNSICTTVNVFLQEFGLFIHTIDNIVDTLDSPNTTRKI